MCYTPSTDEQSGYCRYVQPAALVITFTYFCMTRWLKGQICHLSNNESTYISLYPRVGEQRKLQIYFDCHERPDDITTIYKEQQLVAFNLIHSNVDELTVSFQQLGAESLNPSRYGDPNVCLPDLGGLEYAPWLRALYPFPQSMTLPRVFGHRDRVG